MLIPFGPKSSKYMQNSAKSPYHSPALSASVQSFIFLQVPDFLATLFVDIKLPRTLDLSVF
jgi:hypothetical protein